MRIPLFSYIILTRSVVTVGQACFTVDETVLAVSRATSKNFPALPLLESNNYLSIGLQIISATLSLIGVLLSRGPTNWNRLQTNYFLKKFKELAGTVKKSALHSKLPCFFPVFFGFSVLTALLSCTARALSAYLFVARLLKPFPVLITYFIGILVVPAIFFSALLFNGVNMLNNAAKFIEKPSFSFQLGSALSVFSCISTAVAMRFFILHFFNQFTQNPAYQIPLQILFSVAELMMGLFTMTASFQANWWRETKFLLTQSPLLMGLMVGDTLTGWLGYSLITWYSISTDLLKQVTVLSPPFMFFMLALSAGIALLPSLTYQHYLLSSIADGFFLVKAFLQRPKTTFKNGFPRPLPLRDTREPATVPTFKA